jgi:hypothetical protein
VLGGDAFPWGFDASTGHWSFETILKQLNTWGVPVARMSDLFKTTDAREVIADLVAGFRRDYNHGSGPESQRATLLKLVTRARFHVGSVIHRLSFRSWPLLPFLDRQVLEQLLGMPAELKTNRKLQKELLIRRSSKLADIPREHNSFFLEPLRPSVLNRHTASLQKRLRRWYWQKWIKEEPRRYYRCYDLNSPQWRAVRLAAEPLRPRLEPWFDRNTSDQLLPPAESRVAFQEPISGSGTARLLLGLLLWTGRD